MGFHPATALPEPVSIVYTFPRQSAGAPLSAFSLPLAAGGVNDRLKQTLFPGAGASVPWLWAASAPPGLRMSRCGFRIRHGKPSEGEAPRATEDEAGFFSPTPPPTRAPLREVSLPFH